MRIREGARIVLLNERDELCLFPFPSNAPVSTSWRHRVRGSAAC